MKFKIVPTIVVVSVFALLFALGFFLLLGPQIKPIGERLARLSLYNADPASLTTQKKKQEEVLAKQEEQARRVAALLPAENQLYDLSVQIDALAKSILVSLNGLTLNAAVADTKKTTSTQAVGESGPVLLPANGQKSTVNITVSGSYQQVQDFVKELTQLNRYIDIQDLAITAAADSEGETIGLITAVTYNIPYAK